MYAKVTHCLTDPLRYSSVNFYEEGFVARNFDGLMHAYFWPLHLHGPPMRKK